MHYLNTEVALVGVNSKSISSHQSGCKTRTTKTKYKKLERVAVGNKTRAIVFGLTVTAVALAMGNIQYTKARTNVNFDISTVGIGLENSFSTIKDKKVEYVASNIDRMNNIVERNTAVADSIIDSINAVGSKQTASSYVKVAPGQMVNTRALNDNGELVAEANELGEIQEAVSTNTVEEVPGPLLDIANPDANYNGQILSMTGQNRANLESLVFNEAGDQGFIGACLVAQAIRDQMMESGIRDARTIKRKYGYEAAINGRTNETAKQAVSYIFDHGGMAVKHRIIYFYAPKLVRSSWHETQNFIVEYKGHRVFDRR